MFDIRITSLLFLLPISGLTQSLDWEEIEKDIEYLNSQRVLFSKVENWLEGTRVESILMDSIYIHNGNSPQKAELTVYHYGRSNPSELKIPLKQIDSITHDDYVLNLHVSTLDPPIYSLMYEQIDLFQGNLHVLHFVIERFRRIVDFYKFGQSNDEDR
ncbi:hypothetical protein [Gramella sp. KN1008]|uniref:hypothetical protein n=1 Tax=Gramella sp. KN1008 TaxID=2529298 RepID=UPI001038C2EF|nr:hypothetical protein [Gramella sp. KN1008]TBW28250.1 hypothetical protein EZJ28_05755 [Gramella sp. KN1008]